MFWCWLAEREGASCFDTIVFVFDFGNNWAVLALSLPTIARVSGYNFITSPLARSVAQLRYNPLKIFLHRH